ncbi:MAG TPA: LLM class flavin-dependent oxidoreductase [Dehalococcoidia bacterium]|nr:LLM class flavin-dependent oxidoreductase [Dehalococcoidia bacterium]
MNFGTFHVLHQPDGRSEPSERTIYETQLELMVAAEDLGFESVWLAEHHFSNVGVCSSPQVLGAAVAARTKRLRIGMGIILLALHDPVHIAEQLAVLDVISDGRLDVGIGRASGNHEYSGFNISFDETRRRVDEGLTMLRGLWTEDPFSYVGPFRTIRDVSVRPRPIQRPYPPLYFACNSADSVPIAARHGLPMMSSFLVLDDALNERREVYRRVSAEHGHAPEAVEERLARTWNTRWVYVDEDERVARAAFREHLLEYLESVSRHSGRIRVSPDERDAVYQEYLRTEAAFFGTPDRVADQIGRFREKTGIENLLCVMGVGGMDPAAIRRSMELFAAKVLPQFSPSPALA